MILRLRQQLRDCLAQNWMPKFGRNLRQRNEHEPAFRQTRMRNLHSGFVNHVRAVEKNIEIDDSRAARDKLLAAELAFDRLQCFEQLPRRKRSFRFDNAIQKPGLREKIDRLRFINGRAAQNPHASFRQGLDGAFQIRGPIAKVRPEGKIDEFAVRHTGE